MTGVEWFITGIIGGISAGLTIAVLMLYWALKDTWRR